MIPTRTTSCHIEIARSSRGEASGWGIVLADGFEYAGSSRSTRDAAAEAIETAIRLAPGPITIHLGQSIPRAAAARHAAIVRRVTEPRHATRARILAEYAAARAHAAAMASRPAKRHSFLRPAA